MSQAEEKYINIVFNAEDHIFKSATWKREYELITSSNVNGCPLPTPRNNINDFSNIQHRSVIVEIDVGINNFLSTPYMKF